MGERRRRTTAALALTAGLVAACLGGAAAQTGWSTSAVVEVARPAYSVYGATPGCGGEVLVDDALRRALDGFGRGGVEPGAPSRASRAVGEALNLFGLGAVLQDHAVCAEVCARVPHDATRITALLAYVAEGDAGAFRRAHFGRWSDFVHWEPDVDTTRVDELGRHVCATVRQWLNVERRVFLVVAYER